MVLFILAPSVPILQPGRQKIIKLGKQKQVKRKMNEKLGNYKGLIYLIFNELLQTVKRLTMKFLVSSATCKLFKTTELLQTFF